MTKILMMIALVSLGMSGESQAMQPAAPEIIDSLWVCTTDCTAYNEDGDAVLTHNIIWTSKARNQRKAGKDASQACSEYWDGSGAAGTGTTNTNCEYHSPAP